MTSLDLARSTKDGIASLPRSFGRKADIAVGVSGIGLFVLATLIIANSGGYRGAPQGWDGKLLSGLRHATDGGGWVRDACRELMLLATAMGSIPALILFAAAACAVLVRVGKLAVAARFLVVSGIGVGVADLLKHVANRPRPSIVAHWAPYTSSSLPSGHSADSAIVFFLLAGVVANWAITPLGRRAAWAGAIGLVALIGLSRVYLGVHWPTDVLAGWGLGTAWAGATGSFVRLGRP